MPVTNHNFRIDIARCVRCGLCARDCVAGAIGMTADGPALVQPDACIGCQHCLAVCPEAALSIFDKDPADSLPNTGLPDAESMRRLIMGRRSFRHFQPLDIPADLFRDILETSWYAPTGVNMQGVHLAALATRRVMDAFRTKVYGMVEETLKRAENSSGEVAETLREFVDAWRKDGTDNVFRTAPHLVVASTSPGTVCVEADPMIALSTLDLYAQARGVGTVWCGFAKLAIDFCRDPSLWREAGVPEGFTPAYVVLMGLPAFAYPRAVQREPAAVRLVGVDK